MQNFPILKNSLRERGLRLLLQRSYIDYCDYVHRGNWKKAPHLEIVCDALQKIADGETKRLMLFMPPRHGKSMSTTETFPSYFLGRFPDKRVIISSYGGVLAKRFGRRNRQKLREFAPYIFDLSISDEKKSESEWEIDDHTGGLISVGVGGSITGHGADLLIIDDPIRNREDADSQVRREKLWDEWENTLLTRLHPEGSVIIILTRWHEDDLAGRILARESEDWEVISLPAVCDDEETDLLNRKIGDPLWAERGFDKKWAEIKKRNIGSRAWSALYQQKPTPEEGTIINRNWWKWHDGNIKFDSVIQSWDLSFKGGEKSDFVVGIVIGKKGADKYILDLFRDRIGFTDTIQAIENLSNKWKSTNTILIEDAANGAATVDTLQRRIAGIIPIKPQGSKIDRVNAITPEIESGNVFLPSVEKASWVEDFVEECSVFPNGKNDDQIDALSQALNYFRNRKTEGTYDGFWDIL